MALKIKNSSNSPVTNGNNVVFEYRPIVSGIPNAPQALPMGMPTYSNVGFNPVSVPKAPALEMPESSLPRALNYYADYSGCGFWRLIWPEHLLNAHQKMTVHGSTVMCFDPRYFIGVKTVRIQRQATPQQFEFIKFFRVAFVVSRSMAAKLMQHNNSIMF